jgi:hypothetical protein
MKIRRQQNHSGSLAFIDMLFNLLIVFVLLFMIALMFMNDITKKKDIETKAEVLVILTWPEQSAHDMDLWIKTPDGGKIGFSSRENTYMHYEYDDRGEFNYITENEKTTVITTRKEVITFRGKQNGRFVVNVHFFKSNLDRVEETVPVTVEIIELNPSYRVLAKKNLEMDKQGQEKTAFSFTIESGNIVHIEEIDEKFIVG